MFPSSGRRATYCREFPGSGCRSPMEKRLCRVCGGSFEVPSTSQQIYCGEECRIRPVLRSCDRCGEEFRVTKGNRDQPYCSRKCYGLDQRVDRAPVPDPRCRTCNRVFKRTGSQVYCSYRCRQSSGTRRGKIYGSLRREIFRRDGYTCQLCGRPEMTGRWGSLAIDHRVPVSLGGDDSESNLQAAHNGCNSIRGNLPLGLIPSEVFIEVYDATYGQEKAEIVPPPPNGELAFEVTS